MQYRKQPLSYQEQIDLLESRGLHVPDKAVASNYLSHISYYRLSAYMLPFQGVKDNFNSGTNFKDIVDLYVFDRELRLIVFDAMERIEVAIRTQMIYQLSIKYGAHWHTDTTIFKAWSKHSDIMKAIQDHCDSNNREVFIDHYMKKYTSPSTPPCWMSIEILTMGQLSRLYQALLENRDKKEIAAHFQLHHTVFSSWIHTMTYVRNICAHHARLWNRDFAIQPDLLKKPMLPWIDLKYNNNRRCYYFLSTLQYFLHTINPKGHFKQKIIDLIFKHPTVPTQYMGFPKAWQDEPLWK